MKNRIIRVLLLLSATALVSIPCVAPVMGHEEIIETAVVVQDNTTTDTEDKYFTWFEGWTTCMVAIREEPSDESNIAEICDTCTYFHCHETNNSEWTAVLYNNATTGYIKSEYITKSEIENQYREFIYKQVKAKDKKKWFLEYKEFMDNPNFEDKPETIYDCFTEQELDLLFRVVQAEIGDYTFEQKVNVANVIYNRVYHERFGETLSEVLIPGQFATISNGRINKVKVDEDTILACEYAFLFEDTTNGALFFDSDGSLDYKKIDNDGAHNFYILEEDK